MIPVTPGIDLYWLPLGAGGHSVRWNGRIFELLCAVRERRAARPLFHSALRISLPPHRYVVEMTPVWNVPVGDRGVVGEGAVGARWAGRWRFGRYEVHCWRGGMIGDVGEAVDGPQRLTSDVEICRSLLVKLPEVPCVVWGRDEMRTGSMWNSNSVVAWALSVAGLDAAGLAPPAGGSAPGWNAGIVAAARRVPPTVPALPR
ncbi:hypothetical protein [Antrihabitans sp. YC2-6]|uniref:hypothetical protein n=1 Tax=Antrihabitans sp. YC2-6 TaxID=2799498 RepID=UPI0018F6D2D9|nr:hypothetical protein [Antrihabitans sp. YC2-6]MBJ8347090.1 hypothetical protein [Antrihabitans sp. YC2-6]